MKTLDLNPQEQGALLRLLDQHLPALESFSRQTEYGDVQIYNARQDVKALRAIRVRLRS